MNTLVDTCFIRNSVSAKEMNCEHVKDVKRKNTAHDIGSLPFENFAALINRIEFFENANNRSSKRSTFFLFKTKINSLFSPLFWEMNFDWNFSSENSEICIEYASEYVSKPRRKVDMSNALDDFVSLMERLVERTPNDVTSDVT